MSLEIIVLSTRRLSSIYEWQRSIDGLGVPLRISTKKPLSELRGALPVQFGPVMSSFECAHQDFDDIKHTYADVKFDRQLICAISMRWGGDVTSGYAALIAAAGYALRSNGVIFDCQECTFLSPQRAIDNANNLRAAKSQIDSAVRRVIEQLAAEEGPPSRNERGRA